MDFQLIDHKDKFEISNIDSLTSDSVNKGVISKHGNLLPNNVRCIISGPSNSGKTNVLFNLLTHPNGLHFNNVYIFSKSLYQAKYQLLEKVLSDVSEIKYYKFDDQDKIMEPSHAEPYSVFIFDDVSSENQSKMRSYFTMGRHNNIDSIYIGQTYSKIPKQLLRDNVNLIVIFKQDETNLKHIFKDHVGVDFTYDHFKDLCCKAWKENYGFVVISKEDPLNYGRYRIGFDKFVSIKEKHI